MNAGAGTTRVKFSPPVFFYVCDTPDIVKNRKKYWEIVALDRQRFKDRIEQVKFVLDPILLARVKNATQWKK